MVLSEGDLHVSPPSCRPKVFGLTEGFIDKGFKSPRRCQASLVIDTFTAGCINIGEENNCWTDKDVGKILTQISQHGA